MKYQFDKYNRAFMDHLKRHLPGSKTPGSVFGGRFTTARRVIDYAYEHIESQYRGALLAVEIDCREFVGLEAIVAIEDIPLGIPHKRQTREVKKGSGRAESYTVLVVKGMKKQPTTKMSIIAQPLPGTKKHGFASIYPGRLCPDFTDHKFWREHAFIT